MIPVIHIALAYLSGFLIFCVLQAMAINGVHTAFKGSKRVDTLNNKVDYEGMAIYMLAPKFFEKHKNRTWSKPIFSCVKCMASVWGALTYWPFVIWLFGFEWCEIPIFIADVFILVYLNFYFYQKA